MSYHKFNEFARRDDTIQRLKLGGILALISDAGMPGISDPGTELVRVISSMCLHVKVSFEGTNFVFKDQEALALSWVVRLCSQPHFDICALDAVSCTGEGMCGIQCACASRPWCFCCHYCLGCFWITNR